MNTVRAELDRVTREFAELEYEHEQVCAALILLKTTIDETTANIAASGDIVLSVERSTALEELIENPPEPSPALVEPMHENPVTFLPEDDDLVTNYMSAKKPEMVALDESEFYPDGSRIEPAPVSTPKSNKKRGR